MTDRNMFVLLSWKPISQFTPCSTLSNRKFLKRFILIIPILYSKILLRCLGEIFLANCNHSVYIMPIPHHLLKSAMTPPPWFSPAIEWASFWMTPLTKSSIKRLGFEAPVGNFFRMPFALDRSWNSPTTVLPATTRRWSLVEIWLCNLDHSSNVVPVLPILVKPRRNSTTLVFPADNVRISLNYPIYSL